MPFQPAIDEPSNACPSSNLSGPNTLAGTRDVLFLAAGVGEAKVDELDLFVLDHLEDVGTGGHAGLLVVRGGRGIAALQKKDNEI